MKHILALLILASLLTSCRETWTTGTKNRFYEGCTSEAIKWAGTTEKAQSYCDCVFFKMVAKYPHEEDAMLHLDSLAKDPDLIACKEEIENSGK